jgi:hypothetical protein
MQRNRKRQRIAPPSWWVRCALLALACLQVVAPTWHICSMGATGPAPGQQMSMEHCGMPSMQQSVKLGTATLSNLPMEEDFCLARLLQHVLGNSQFQLVLDFNAIPVSSLQEHASSIPLHRTLPVTQARGPPSHLL